MYASDPVCLGLYFLDFGWCAWLYACVHGCYDRQARHPLPTGGRHAVHTTPAIPSDSQRVYTASDAAALDLFTGTDPVIRCHLHPPGKILTPGGDPGAHHLARQTCLLGCIYI